MTDNKSAAVEVKGYGFSYEGTDRFVLRNCDFTLNYGEFIVLSGLSGEGKSTLLASINGIIPNILSGTQEGNIFIKGENIRGKRIADISRMVGSVLQNADSQIVHAKVGDEIAFGCENQKLPPEEIAIRICNTCAMMELNPEWSTRALSGGQKQRLITAATLAMGQKILLFDEPLAHLDLEGAHILLRCLKKLTQAGYAVLFIEHRLDMVIPYANKVAWMQDGTVALSDDKTTFLRQRLNVISGTSKTSSSGKRCLEAHHLKFSVAGRDILKDVSFTVHQGERVVILGDNGCGKTTLLRILARLQKPSAGRVLHFLDATLDEKPSTKWFRLVGYVYQNPNYQLFMPRVTEEIGFQSTNDKTTQRFMEVFDLARFADRHPQSLSEGQKRKLSIAAIAAAHPRILLLDEPTVGQDSDGLRRIIAAINEINRTHGTTIITVTHDYRCAGAIADKVIWVKNGEVYQTGDATLIDAYFTRNVNDTSTAMFLPESALSLSRFYRASRLPHPSPC